MQQNTTKIPILEFGFYNEESKSYFSLTTYEGENNLMPPWLTSFNYVRKANAFGGGTWTISLVDPTFTLLDILNRVYAGGSITEEEILNKNFLNSATEEILSGNSLGRVKFQYGHVDSQGEGFRSGEILGWIKKISPSITSKQKLSLTITGVDINPTVSTSRLILDASYLQGQTLDTALNSFVNKYATELGCTGAHVIYMSEDLKSLQLPATIGEDDMSFINSFLVRGAITLPRYIKYLETVLVDHGIKISIGSIIPNYQSTTQSFSPVVIGVLAYVEKQLENLSGRLRITVSRIHVDNTPTFYVNTQQSDFIMGEDGFTYMSNGIENDSRIISFDPTINPLIPSMLGGRRLSAETTDTHTLEPSLPIIVEPETNLTLVVEDALSIMEVPTRIVTNVVTGLSEAQVKQKMEYLNGWLCQMPLRASMRCQYIQNIINPYETVRVFVTTPQGQLFFTSGVYLVTEVSDSITPGRFLTTYQMIKSGTQSMETVVPQYGSKLT